MENCRYAVIAVGKRLFPFFVTKCGRAAFHVLSIVMLIKRASSNKLKILFLADSRLNLRNDGNRQVRHLNFNM